LSKSFYRRMIEEKNLIHEVIEIESEEMVHFVEMELLLSLIEQAPETEKKSILNTMSKIDFCNGDLMHFLKYLAEHYIKGWEKVLQHGK
jgi:hypothetical protein